MLKLDLTGRGRGDCKFRIVGFIKPLTVPVNIIVLQLRHCVYDFLIKSDCIFSCINYPFTTYAVKIIFDISVLAPKHITVSNHASVYIFSPSGMFVNLPQICLNSFMLL
jgi:hypothetical protein